MKKTLIVAVAVALGGSSVAAQAPGWLRHTAISPDGKTIAFTHRGDIYTVPSAGGQARQLTSNAAYDTAPFWSPDGTRIAFTSDRDGSPDVFVVAANGGTPVRITTNSGSETVQGWLNDSTVVFASSDVSAEPTGLNNPFFAITYKVAARPGARPEVFLPLATRGGDFNAAGDFIFEDRKSYEDGLRKHEMSSGTGDIHLYRNGAFTRLTTFKGNDRNPVWMGGDNYAYLSEQNGTLNVYMATVGQPGERRLTDFTRNPVRHLSAAADGSLLAFSHDGDIYTLVPGQEPVKVAVEIAADNYDRDYVKRYVNAGATTMAPSPDGEEVAFVLRGDVYVTSTKYKTTRRITDTPAQERRVSFAPDGRTLVYDSERDGIWQLFTAKIAKDDEKHFAYATEIIEEPLYRGERTAQQPQFSPDGKKVAFLEDRTELRVIDLDTKAVHTALPGKYNYSYSDGDVNFAWSPDSHWFLVDYIGTGGWNNSDIALVSEDGDTVIDLTESGYSDGNARWALGGKAITYQTGRYGMKAQGSWGNEEDVMLMVLDPDAWDRFNMTKEEAELADKAEADAKDKADEAADKDKKSKKKNAKADKADDKKALVFDTDNRKYRHVRLTQGSAQMGDYLLSAKGDKLYYQVPSPEGDYNLYALDIREGEVELLARGLRGGFDPDAKCENIYVISGSGMKKVNLDTGKTDAIEFDAPYDRHPSLEREYIYDHAWQQVKDKFYDADIHGVDWDYYRDHYRQFLPAVSNNTDFAELLSELLGELNASHTGARYYGSSSALPTASLGAYFDPAYTGEGLKISYIMPRGPLAAKNTGLVPGDIILAIDGTTIAPGADYFPLLEGKAGKKTRLHVAKTDGRFADVEVKPVPQYAISSLAYAAWVERNQALVDSLSGGRLGYVHIQGMDTPSYQRVYNDLLGKYRNAEAVIVDTRFNGGGWLHNDVALLLGGKEYVRYSPRGRYIGSDPFSQWTKPSVMITNEANYSDAHGTPYVYQTLGIGDIVGAPVPGTMTAVWWETQVDPTLVFGIPQVTSLDRNGKPLENQQLQPDVEVYNTPADIVAGHDAQIERAVAHLLKKLDESK